MTSSIGRVNGTIPQPAATTPPADAPKDTQSGFWQTAGRAMVHSGDVVQDLGVAAGIDTTGGDGVEFRPLNMTTMVGVNGLLAGVATARQARLAGEKMSFGQVAGRGFENFGTNGLRITPTLVSAVIGPAAADGMTKLAPNLLPKYKNDMSKGDKTAVQAKRAVVGGVAVGLLAGAAWLIKPSLFKSAGFMSSKAIEGFTHVNAQGVSKVVPAMTRDAVFSNRVLLGLAGGVGTLVLANQAAGAEGRDKAMWGAAAAATGALTLGGIGLMPKITRGAEKAGALAFMPGKATAIFWKPNVQWFKEYATKIAPLTAIPAGTAASQYFDIVDDWDTITGSRSPFR